MQKNAIIIKFTKMDVHPFSEATNHVNILHVADDDGNGSNEWPDSAQI